VEDGDDYGFEGDSLPLHFMHFRFPPEDMYTISEDGLEVNPSFYNLTGDQSFEPSDRLSYVGRRQTDTYFTYYVDIEYEPETEGEEAGVTLFANQWQHADLGLVLLDGKLQARLRSTAFGADNTTIDSAGSETIVDVPEELVGETIRLQIQTASDTEFEFSFGAACEDGDLELVGTISGALTSGANAQFTGKSTFIVASIFLVTNKLTMHRNHRRHLRDRQRRRRLHTRNLQPLGLRRPRAKDRLQRDGVPHGD
jgi:beta-xylosidase